LISEFRYSATTPFVEQYQPSQKPTQRRLSL
jgi:hypothetical protein